MVVYVCYVSLMRFAVLMLNADVWKVSITTGIYEPPGRDEENDEVAVNTNNNANDKDEKEESSYVSQKKKSLKYQVAPWAPVGDLFIVIYGDRGKTGLLPLISDKPSNSKKFLSGSVDDFKVNILAIVLFRKYIVFYSPDTRSNRKLVIVGYGQYCLFLL